jgi:hypothetical protein
MIQAIEDKALALYASVMGKLAELKSGERGQTSGEYVAVTAVAVLIAITVIYVAFSGALTDAITAIGDGLESWVNSIF